MIDWSTGQFESHGEIADVQWEMVARRDDDPDVEGERWQWYVIATAISSSTRDSLHVEAEGFVGSEKDAKKHALSALRRILYGFCTDEPEDWPRALSMLLAAAEAHGISRLHEAGVNLDSACEKARAVLKTVPGKVP